MWRSIILILLLSASAFGDWQPAGYTKWQDADKYRITLGQVIQNYEDSTGWNEINNDFHLNGNSFYVSWESVLKTTVAQTGEVIVTFTHNDIDYTVIQELKSLKFFRKSDSTWFNIDDTPDWSNISQDSNIIKWTNVFPAVDYRVRKVNGATQQGIFYKPAFIDSAVALYDERPDSADIYLANVTRVTLSNIDFADSSYGTVRKRTLKRLGNLILQMNQQRLHFPGSDTLPEVPVWQRHVIVGGNLYILEFVKMSHIKQIYELYPNAMVWHNTTDTLKIADDVRDNWLYGRIGFTNYNQGAHTHFMWGNLPTSSTHILHSYLWFNFPTGSYDAIACTLKAYCLIDDNIADTGDVFHSTRPHAPDYVGDNVDAPADSGEMSWGLLFEGGSIADTAWTFAGGDMESRVLGSLIVTATGANAWYYWVIDSAYVDSILKTTKENYGLFIKGRATDAGSRKTFASIENASNNEFLIVVYQASGPPPETKSFRRREERRR